MVEVVGIRIGGGKTFYFDPNGNKMSPGDEVLVETSGGTELGECAEAVKEVDDEKVTLPLRRVLRVGEKKCGVCPRRDRERERQAVESSQAKANERGLDMKFVEAEYAGDGSKLILYFIAEGRVDFRELVKDLASAFHTRIELRQIGVRDEAKLLGGIGICGREFCCKQFLSDFHPVSIKMAKEQSLSLNPTKISGSCGRLMCCLKYEQEAYTDLLKRTPRGGSHVNTPDGEGTIIEVALLRGRVKVLLDDANEPLAKYYSISDIKVLRNGKARPQRQQEDKGNGV